jgi:inorganic pyrophosphatase
MCLVEATVIGNMQMIDSGEEDDKIISVATEDPSVNHYTSVDDLPRHFISELRNYFENYKILENKEVRIEDFQSKEIAYHIINDAVELYKQKFG